MNTVRVLLFVLCVLVLVSASYAQTTHGLLGTSTTGTTGSSGMKPMGTAIVTSIPAKVSYQGLLTTAAGSPAADGSYSLKFEIFNAVSAGSSLWNETQASVTVTHGTFSVLLGSVTPLPNIFSTPLWVEVTAVSGPGISSSIVFAPRVELASAPYSLGPWMSKNDTLYATGKYVGINTASPQYVLDASSSVPNIARFSVQGYQPLNLIANAPQIGFNIAWNSGFRYDNGGPGGTIAFNQDVADGFSVTTAIPGTAGTVAPLATRLAITNSGNVGIDTANPQARLHVNGSFRADSSATIGNTGVPGTLNVITHSATSSGLWVSDYGGYGTQLLTYDDSNHVHIYLQPDANGQGGYLGVTRANNEMGFEVDGNADGTNSPRVVMYGRTKGLTLEPDLAGDAAVELPDSSISSHEILDLPGLVRASSSSGFTLSRTGTALNVLSATINVPGPGYVLAITSAIAQLYGDTIGDIITGVETTPSANPGVPYALFGGSGEKLSAVTYRWGDVNATKSFSVGGAGSFTYYLNARQGLAGGTATVYYPTLTLVYFPKSYGSVASILPLAEAAGFSSGQQVSISAFPGLPAQSTQTAVQVDLRELELKATQARLEAERAERRLIEARMSVNGQQPQPQH